MVYILSPLISNHGAACKPSGWNPVVYILTILTSFVWVDVSSGVDTEGVGVSTVEGAAHPIGISSTQIVMNNSLFIGERIVALSAGIVNARKTLWSLWIFFQPYPLKPAFFHLFKFLHQIFRQWLWLVSFQYLNGLFI